MNEETIKELMVPIKNYINSNTIDGNDLPVIVQNFFPTDEQVAEIAKFLTQNVQQLKVLTEDKLLDRTRQILTNALNEAAIDVYREKISINEEYDKEFNDGPEVSDWDEERFLSWDDDLDLGMDTYEEFED